MDSYSILEMKRFLKSLNPTKKKKEMCVAGIEMLLLTKSDITYMASQNTSIDDASKFLHKKIMSM